MHSIMEYLFGTNALVPHGYCLLWRPDLVAMHAVGDGVIAVAYLAIPAGIVAFVRQRRDMSRDHLQVAALFSAFIVACALTHAASLATLWYPMYGLQGLIKAVTAAPVSVVSPYLYSGMIWAVLLGYVVFGDFPDAWTIAGGGLIVASGLYVFHREQMAARQSQD